MRLLLGTRNQHKAREIGRMLEGIPLRVATLDEFPGIPEVDEDGRTLEENARKKAVFCARQSGLWSLADDTGLEVTALHGAPGVYSARYAGPDCDYADNNRKLLEALRGVPDKDRHAAFRCVMALSSPDGQVILEQGRLDGFILKEVRGGHGFGYDPVFYLPEQRKTLAELSLAEKNEISHRAKALLAMRVHLDRLGRGGQRNVLALASGFKRKNSICVICGLEMEAWHCREICPGCGYQIDCSDPF